MKSKILSGLALFLLSTVTAFAQMKVSGNIIDEFGEPLMAATVLETGTTNGTTTDFDGNFSLTMQSSQHTLTISYVGYKTQVLKPQAVMKVQMTVDNVLDEMVVVGYTVEKKADLTGAVAVVDTKALQTASDPDPIRALQGKVPGMTITTNGSPSGTGTIRIRGIGSFNASNSPLIVIDGMPTQQSLNSLNTADIESMQVLKDAASASIYGSRAANGVIIITTKKGNKGDGKIKIDFNANWTAQMYNKQTMMSLCNTSEYATAMAQAALNDGLDPVAYASNYGLNLNAQQGTPIKAWNPATGSYVNYTVDGLYGGYINNKSTMMYSNTDWLKEISRTGFIQNYDLSVSRGGEKGSTVFTLGYKRNDGILKNTDFENLSARLNSVYNINKIISVGENLTITHTSQVDCAPMENALKMAPTVPVYEKDGVTFAGPVGGMSDRHNPMRELEWNKDNSLGIWRIFGNAYVDIKPIKGLVIRSSFGIDYDGAFIHSVNKTFHSDIVNNDKASTTLSHSNEMRWNWTNTATYGFDFCENHHINALLGFETYKDTRIDFSAYSEGFDEETLNYMWPDAATGNMRNTGYKSGYALVSLFGKIDYNWDERILASFTIRRDGSSRFGKNNKYATFPAATLGYRLSKDIKGAESWLDDLKVRLSWGATGNQDISNSARYNIFFADYGNDRVTSTAYDLYLQGSGIFPSGYRVNQAASQNLKWETTYQWNAGIDFTLLNQRLFGSIDAYKKDIKDMLINPAYLAALGEGGASWANGPSSRNLGMEFLVGWRDNLACGFGYKINANLDFFRNKVTSLPATATGSYAHTTRQNIIEAGKPFGARTGYVCDGLFQTKEEVLASGQENARVGGLKYRDLNGDGKIGEEDQTWIFNPVPNFSYGLNFEFTYKNFDLTMFWQGVAGVDVWNDQKYQTDFWSLTDAGSNKGNRLLDAWTTNNPTSTIPALTTDNTSNEGRSSSYFVENGSYLKLRTLQLGYNLPKNIFGKLNVERARIYASGQNLLTIKGGSLTCSDPENPTWAYPTTTSFTLGIQLGF